MKKLFALILAAVMVCGMVSLAMAETAVLDGYTQYESVTGTFTLQLPADYIHLDSDVFQLLTDAIEKPELLEAAGIDAEMASALSQAVSAIDTTTIDFFFTPDYIGNVNALAMKDVGITGSMLPVVKSILDEQIKSTFTSYGLTEDDLVFHDLEQLGDYTWYSFNAAVTGNSIIQFICFDEDGTQYQLAFTNVDDDTAKQIVSTFTLTGN